MIEKSSLITIFLEAIMAIFTIFTFFKIDSTNLPQILQPIFIVPWYFYAIAFLLILIVYLWLSNRNKIRGHPFVVAAIRESVTGGEIPYEGVIWNVVVPLPSSFENGHEYDRRLPNLFRIDTPPRCPKCGVEIGQTENLLFGYTWNCVKCGFSKQSKESYYQVANKVEKIVKKDCEDGVISYSKLFNNPRGR